MNEIENQGNKACKNLASDLWSQEVPSRHNHSRHQEPDSLSFSNDIYSAKLDKQRESSWFPPLKIENLPLPGEDPVGRFLETGARNIPNVLDDVGHGLVDGIKDVGDVVGDIGGAIDRGLRSIFSFL